VPLPAGAIGPIPPGHQPEEYDRLRRRVLWSLPTGLFVVGSRAGGERNLMTCNWVMQVATVPKLVAVAVESESVTRRLVQSGGGFAVSVLPRSERAVVRRFVKPTESVTTDAQGVALTMQGQPVREVAGGLPRLASARSWLVCEVRHLLDWAGDGAEGQSSHVLAVGEVVDAGEAEGDPGPGDGVLRMEDTRMSYGG
jgi:flavin reductase (DIM6/NTAB) family NADH-FMN oxidoreductase RutF